MNAHCEDHSGTCTRMDRAERDIQTLYGYRETDKAVRGNANMSAWLFVGSAVLNVATMVIMWIKG